ncbi:hypothetical protein [Arthrobacter sp. D5-1]|uniref:hypothetical protein n=1 Tax=Arthrobacter sp. D5-1 TaxID=1477518 RepID=UPI001A99D2F4|nr:hypothetical protein [Arthrobacter sp. D5-1]QSZ49407.1 hypothetical protein AYX22_14040 [Arthrobacter sp. D5-1]
MFPLANGQMVIRERRRQITDPYSQDSTLADWSDPLELTLEGVAIAPSSSVESNAVDRNPVVTQMSIYCGPDEDILAGDRIRDGATLWDVQGEVANWKNALTGWAPGAEFRVKKVTG